MAVLCHLSKHAGEVVSRRDLIAAVWGDAFVGDEALSHCIWDLRRALGDEARSPSYIQTVPRRGYRLIASVEPAVAAVETVEEPVSVPSAEEAGVAGGSSLGRKHWREARGRQWGNDRRSSLGVLGGAILAIVLVAALVWMRGFPPEPLHVLVLPAELELRDPASDDGLGPAPLSLAAANTESSSLGFLAGAIGLTPLDPSLVEGIGARTPLEAARAVAADEVLVASLEGRGSLCWLTLRRIEGDRGATLWAESIESRCRPEESLLFADGVRALLARAYPGRSPDSEGTSGIVPEDYRLFLEVHQRLASGRSPSEVDLRALIGVTESSPGFLEAHLRVADLATSLFQQDHRREDLDRARRAITDAEALAPDDLRPRERRLRLALLEDDVEAAAQVLADLRRHDPAAVATLDAEARLFEHQGQLSEALEPRRRLVEARPTWRELYRLASLELRLGQVDEARKHLEQLLERSPRNRWGRSRLAELELFHGELDRAAELYRGLLDEGPRRNYWTNLGIAHFLDGNYGPAADSYRRALAMAPGHPTALFNLAEAEHALGQTATGPLFEQALEALEELAAEGALGPIDSLIRALCLAWLDRPQEAVAVAHRVVQEHGEDTEVAYLAAQVHALAGDFNVALLLAGQARSQGLEPRWFRVPAFESMSQVEGFQALLEP